VTIPLGGGALSHRVVLLGCFGVPGIIAAVADLLGLGSWVWVGGLVLGIVAASLFVLNEVWDRASFGVKAIAATLGVASAFWTIGMAFAPRLTLLAIRGETTQVQVVGRSVTHVPGTRGGYDEYCYRLVRADGGVLPGRICRESDEFVVGETLEVLADRDGWFAPETTGSEADASAWWYVALGGLIPTLAVGWILGGLAHRMDNGEDVLRWRRSVAATRHGRSRGFRRGGGG
jgi:hypothetical protein